MVSVGICIGWLVAIKLSRLWGFDLKMWPSPQVGLGPISNIGPTSKYSMSTGLNYQNMQSVITLRCWSFIFRSHLSTTEGRWPYELAIEVKKCNNNEKQSKYDWSVILTRTVTTTTTTTIITPLSLRNAMFDSKQVKSDGSHRHHHHDLHVLIQDLHSHQIKRRPKRVEMPFYAKFMMQYIFAFWEFIQPMI